MRERIVCVTLGVLVVAVAASAQAPSGEAVYKQHCAACHEGSIPRMPTREALRGLTPEHVDTALSSFSMRRQAAALSPAERRAVAAFVTGRPAGSYRAPLDVIPKTAYCSAAGIRQRRRVDRAVVERLGHQRPEHAIPVRPGRRHLRGRGSAAEVEVGVRLPGVSASGSQVSVVGNRVFVGSRNGVVVRARRQDRLPGVGRGSRRCCPIHSRRGALGQRSRHGLFR